MLELLQQSALVAVCVGALPLIAAWLVITTALGVVHVVVSVFRWAARRLGNARAAAGALRLYPMERRPR